MIGGKEKRQTQYATINVAYFFLCKNKKVYMGA